MFNLRSKRICNFTNKITNLLSDLNFILHGYVLARQIPDKAIETLRRRSYIHRHTIFYLVIIGKDSSTTTKGKTINKNTHRGMLQLNRTNITYCAINVTYKETITYQRNIDRVGEHFCFVEQWVLIINIKRKIVRQNKWFPFCLYSNV